MVCSDLELRHFCGSFVTVFVRFMQLVSVVPTDPVILSRLGDLYDGTQDKSQAFQYQFEVGCCVFLSVCLSVCLSGFLLLMMAAW